MANDFNKIFSGETLWTFINDYNNFIDFFMSFLVFNIPNKNSSFGYFCNIFGKAFRDNFKTIATRDSDNR